MNKRFLLCELSDEDYAYAQFSFHREYKEAAKRLSLHAENGMKTVI